MSPGRIVSSASCTAWGRPRNLRNRVLHARSLATDGSVPVQPGARRHQPLPRIWQGLARPEWARRAWMRVSQRNLIAKYLPVRHADFDAPAKHLPSRVQACQRRVHAWSSRVRISCQIAIVPGVDARLGLGAHMMPAAILNSDRTDIHGGMAQSFAPRSRIHRLGVVCACVDQGTRIPQTKHLVMLTGRSMCAGWIWAIPIWTRAMDLAAGFADTHLPAAHVPDDLARSEHRPVRGALSPYSAPDAVASALAPTHQNQRRIAIAKSSAPLHRRDKAG